MVGEKIMFTLARIALGLLGFVFMIHFACRPEGSTPSKLQSAPPVVVLKELRPDRTKTGQVFNLQPNGQSAIVCMMENGNPSVIVVLNDEKLETVYGDPTWVSAFVPSKYYQSPGEVRVFLLDPTANLQSNSLFFKVVH